MLDSVWSLQYRIPGPLCAFAGPAAPAARADAGEHAGAEPLLLPHFRCYCLMLGANTLPRFWWTLSCAASLHWLEVSSVISAACQGLRGSEAVA